MLAHDAESPQVKLKSIRVRNYKSYKDSGPLSLSPGFNFVVGPNNVGKTALLEAFRLQATGNHPHRSEGVSEDKVDLGTSMFDFEISVSGPELDSLLLVPGRSLVIPSPSPANSYDGACKVLNQITRDPETVFTYRALSATLPWQITAWPPFRTSIPFEGRVSCMLNIEDSSRWTNGGNSNDDSIRHVLTEFCQRKIYVFSAQRLEISRCSIEDTDVLSPNARNLPAVLFKLNKNRRLFDKFENLLRQVFPSVKSVSISQSGQELEIFVYNVETDRIDLAMRLGDSGTGLSQVMAILYVAITIRNGVIVIDEPSSFLHPSASKKLMQILSMFNTNQYIISTHSSEIISISDPEQVFRVRLDHGVAIVDSLDLRQIDQIKSMLDSIGASLSDVFGLEAAIWVEGYTEKECFPHILREILGMGIVGASFLAVRHTSDFEKKRGDPIAAWDIYERLSQGDALVAPAVSFGFDLDGRPQKLIEEMSRRSRGKAKFLPRETFENYLLDAEAIASVIGVELGSEIDPAAIKNALRDTISRHKSLAAERGATIEHCRAPEVLKDIFYEFSGNSLSYNKMEHSVALSRWIVANKPETFEELAAYIASLVPSEFIQQTH